MTKKLIKPIHWFMGRKNLSHYGVYYFKCLSYGYRRPFRRTSISVEVHVIVVLPINERRYPP